MADLTLHDVTKTFGSHVVLDSLNLQIKSGECFTIIGPSGCGKTIILRLIAGFEPPDRGEVLIGIKKVAGPNFALPPEDRHIG
ncbi:MAG: ATP-binding cassette domain-containing protein, partial [Rectinema sp.]|nr:ATP-binding cassette domain-containing protein [Rectinema sp.]